MICALFQEISLFQRCLGGKKSVHFADSSVTVGGRQEDGVNVDSKTSSFGSLGVGIHQQNKFSRSRITEGK